MLFYRRARFKPKGYPLLTSASVETFCHFVEDDDNVLFSSPDGNTGYSDLSSQDRPALKDLANAESILIFSADKGCEYNSNIKNITAQR